MKAAPVIYWFRQDLRLDDLPGLCAATAAEGRPLLPVYILDEDSPGERAPGGAARWWLHGSLAALAAALEARGGYLHLRRGSTLAVLQALCDATGATAVYCSRCYEPWAASLEQALHATLGEAGIDFKRYPGSLLFEPGSVTTGAGEPYKVFTPFWRACLRQAPPRGPRPAPEAISWLPEPDGGDALADWQLRPRKPDWAAHWSDLWQPGSTGAQARLRRFLAEAVTAYPQQRDRPAQRGTSLLSPHLHQGDISPFAVWDAARRVAEADPAAAEGVDKFLAELVWREFSYQLLSAYPTIAEQPFKEAFAAFPWSRSTTALRAWQRGETGYPMVDAGMRELWATGHMHNRLRMVTASFLTKHLRIHWREGERWFWDTLVDADMANNCCGWQWVAGSGADAAPYFRIFNPTTQGKKFDPDGAYIRRWVPELAGLSDRHLFAPWEAPDDALAQAGVQLGQTYPYPIVDHGTAREAALAAYREVSAGG